MADDNLNEVLETKLDLGDEDNEIEAEEDEDELHQVQPPGVRVEDGSGADYAGLAKQALYPPATNSGGPR